jgi:putative FmdB family regulatory protein
MPIYEYKCSNCGAQFELLRKVSDAPPKRCKKCGGHLKKILSPPALQFKGPGFYATDYARKRGRAVAGKKDKAEDTGKLKEEKPPAAKSDKESSPE